MRDFFMGLGGNSIAGVIFEVFQTSEAVARAASLNLSASSKPYFNIVCNVFS